MKKRKKRRGRASTRDRLEDIQVEMLDKVERQFKFDVTEIRAASNRISRIETIHEG